MKQKSKQEIVHTTEGPLSCQLTYYAKVRPLAVCIHNEGSTLCKVY